MAETKVDDRLAGFKARYKVLQDYWSDNRSAALADMKFRALEHWPEKLKKQRDDAGRPTLVVDKLNQYVRQVVNDGRQNRPGIKVRPIDDHGDDDVAEAFQGIIRHICDRSNADDALDTALECAVVNGFGFFRVLTEYLHEQTFDQEIVVQRISNPLAVLLGPHQKADGSDAPDGFIVTDIEKAEFKDKWPNAKETNWDEDKFHDGWVTDNCVTVCEYFYKVEEQTALHLMADGTSVTDEEYQRTIADIPPELVPKPIETRTVPVYKVKWCRFTGGEILEERDWLGKYIPIVPVYGNEFDIEGKKQYSGLIRAAKDAQRLYNYSRSAYAERVALTPKSPWVAPAEGIADYPEWEDANEENYSVLRFNYKDESGNPIPPPQRQSAADIPEGFARDMQLAEHDIQASMGMYNASLGEKSNEKSGRAIMARQREGDTATFHYQDNLNRGVRYLGLILVDLIPKIVGYRKAQRILGEDGESETAEINPNLDKAVEKLGNKVIYNLNVGVYDVSVSAGPSYTTKRQEASEAMMQLIQTNPQLFGVIGDLMIRNMDWPGAEAIADRLKLLLPPEVKQAEQQQGQQPLPPEIQAAQQQIQQASQQLEQAHAQLQQAAQQVQQEQASVNADKSKLDAARAQLDASRHELDSASKVLMARYQELSAKLELQAIKAAQVVPPQMPPVTDETAIDPTAPPGIVPPQGGFFTPENPPAG